MARYGDMRKALDIKLGSLPGFDQTQIAWENTHFTPTEGILYLRPTHVPVSAAMATLAGLQKHEGMYVIEVIAPRGNGTADLLEIADDIYDLFTESLSLTSGTTKIYFSAIERTQTRRIESWVMCSVDINYYTYTS